MVRDVHRLNVAHIHTTLSGIVGATSREEQLRNVEVIVVTLLGIVGAVVRDVQPSNV